MARKKLQVLFCVTQRHKEGANPTPVRASLANRLKPLDVNFRSKPAPTTSDSCTGGFSK
ncbi:hypothetical protein [Chroococcidiopsis sp.]|uniref:hypothetical protein n=1 Tax=Chroococcidiopsis sp. TaxID=3088168 RepID=UPI003F3635B8